jgi:hypothetical protein
MMRRVLDGLDYLGVELGTPEADDLFQTFCLSRLFRQSLWLGKMALPKDLSEIIVLSPEGERYLANAATLPEVMALKEDEKGEVDEFRDTKLRLVLFLEFFHSSGTLVDIPKSNLPKLQEFISNLLLGGTLWAPYLFDQILYKKAFEKFESFPSKLTTEQAQQLADGTPVGLYQLGKLITGPLGIVKSAQSRAYPQPSEIPLFHCESPTCNQIHGCGVDENTGWLNLSRIELYDLGGQDLVDFRRAASLTCIEYLEGDTYDDYLPIDLIGFLGDAFIEAECRLILQQLLLRDVFRNDQLDTIRRLGFKQKQRNDLDLLDKATCLQVILLADDKQIISAIDHCIFSGQIVIPPSEIRKTVAAPIPNSWQRNRCECSSLGFRVRGNHTSQLPMARLRRLIFNLYPEPEDSDSFEWMLRKIPGNSKGEKVELLLRGGDLKNILKQVIFSSLDKLRSSMDQLNASHFPRPQNESEEELFAQRILWKLGFTSSTFELVSNRLSLRTRELRVAAKIDKPTDQWREQVRSIGVNAFVVLEDFLDKT